MSSILEGTNKTQCYTLFEQGVENKDVAQRLGMEIARVSAYHQAFKKEIGDDEVHHPEKCGMISRVLHGRRIINVYETCGFKGDGSPGYCTAAYKKLTRRVTSKAKADGDWLVNLHKELGAQRTYDVVDVDGYGDPGRLIQASVLSLVAHNGVLFVTWPGRADYRWPIVVERGLATYQVKVPTLQHFTDSVITAGLGCDRKVTVIEKAVYGRIHRVAFTVQKQNMSPQEVSRRVESELKFVTSRSSFIRNDLANAAPFIK